MVVAETETSPAPTQTPLPTQTPSPTATFTPWPSPTASPTPVAGTLYVDAGASLGPISPYVYGENNGPWQNLGKRYMPYIEAAGFTILRFPGGNYGDENIFVEARLDDYVALCRSLGAEPMVNVKLYNSSPEDAAKVVRYANITKGYGIKYWGIGNEPTLFATKRKQEGYDTIRYNQEWREFALAMEAVDPTIQFFGPEPHQYTSVSWDNPSDMANKDWVKEFLKANGDMVDIVSIHRYPYGSTNPTIDELMRNSAEWDKIIPFLRAVIHETTGRDLPIAITEVNSHWSAVKGKIASPDTLYNAIWWADVLGRLISQRVEFVNHFGLEGTGGWSLMSSGGPRPAYYVYLLYKQFGQELLYSSSDQDLLRIYAARRSDGALTLMVINMTSNPVQKPLTLDNFTPAGEADLWLLDAEHMAQQLEPVAFATDIILDLPAYSVSLYVIQPAP
ncbi:MAG TPA: hypothetical protein VFF78_09020 [Anaerolineaceae bacterium]|nr:hypothetical protein [Anaerolineaceae bacterium]